MTNEKTHDRNHGDIAWKNNAKVCTQERRKKKKIWTKTCSNNRDRKPLLRGYLFPWRRKSIIVRHHTYFSSRLSIRAYLQKETNNSPYTYITIAVPYKEKASLIRLWYTNNTLLVILRDHTLTCHTYDMSLWGEKLGAHSFVLMHHHWRIYNTSCLSVYTDCFSHFYDRIHQTRKRGFRVFYDANNLAHSNAPNLTIWGWNFIFSAYTAKEKITRNNKPK